MATTTTNASKDIWVTQINGTSTYGNGSGPRLQVGYMSVSGDGWTNRSFIQFNYDKGVTPVASITQVLLKLKVRGTLSCATLGSSIRFLVERCTSTINENSESRECGLTSNVSPPANSEWPGPSVTTSNRVQYSGSPVSGDIISIDVTNLVVDALNAGGTTGTVTVRLIACDATPAYDESTGSRRIAFGSRGSDYVPRLVYTFSTGAAPTTSNTGRLPSSGQVLASSGGFTPTFEGGYADADGDAMQYVQILVGTTSGGSEKWDSGLVAPTSWDGVSHWTKTYAGAALTTGVTYYWKFRVQDSTGATSAYSSVYSFTFAAAVSPTKVSPAASALAVVWNLQSDLNTWTSAGSHAKPWFDWTMTGQSAYQVRVYSAATLGTTLYDSGKVTSGTTELSCPTAFVLGTEYWWTIQTWDGANATTGESSRTAFKMRWGQAIYEYNVGASASYQWSNASVPANTRSAFFFRAATGAAGAGASAWVANLGDLTPGTWINVMVRLATDVAATNSTLSDMTFTYAGSSAVPDQWIVAGGTISLDPSAYRFGTRGLKVVATGAGSVVVYPYRFTTGDDIVVVPGVTYTISGFVRVPTALATGARLQVFAAGGTTTSYVASSYVTSTAATVDGWTRLSCTFTVAAGVTMVRPALVLTAAGANETVWWDAIKMEEGAVATPWQPGWLSPAIVLDGYGINLDASGGATLRIRGTAGGGGDLVEAGTHGFRLTGPTEIAEVADPTTPASGLIKMYGGNAGQHRLRSMDSAGRVTIIPGVSMAPYAYPLGAAFSAGQDAIANLSAVSAGNGGMRVWPIHVPSPMFLQSLSLWNTDTASARAAEWRLFVDNGDATFDFVTGASGTWSFTPTVAAERISTASGAPVYLSPGIYWLVVRNTSTTQTFGVGVTAQGTLTTGPGMGRTGSGAALGVTVDFSALTDTPSLGLVRLNGRIGAETGAY